ncbi:MAG: cytidylate kinase-like family protein [Acidimicrobiia bacterium]|nr:cytidylate kinase-like family protein [Acidimicrobiia bacterium]
MTSLERIDRYLRAEMEKLRSVTPELREPAAPRPFITISRQAGAGGHALAAAMLEVFAHQEDVELFGGWQIFDHNLCEIIAADPAYSGSLDSLLAEEYRTPTTDFFHQLVRSTADQDRVMSRVFQLVRSIAAIGNAIIIGRAGSQVTKGMQPGIRLRVVAPEGVRIKRMMEIATLDERQARNQARKMDAHRASLLRAYFETDIADPTNYDVTWNSASSSLIEIAEATTALLRRRLAETPPV